jgi:hypothetical protein
MRVLFVPALVILGVFGVFLLPLRAEKWESNGPAGSQLGQMIFRGEDRLELYVPQSFEGRTAKEKRRFFGIELFEGMRFERRESDVQLRGRSTIFDFEVKRDRFDYQIHTSRARRPGANACMDCHGGEFPRTTLIVGTEMAHLEPKPITKGNITFTIDEASFDVARAQLNHWFTKRLMARGEVQRGVFRQDRLDLEVAAASLGLAGMVGHRLVWEGRAIVSKMATFTARRTITGELSYRFGKRLKLTVGGGAFLDGYTQFGTDMSDMGALTVNLARNDPQLMPTLFQRLKDERFGYLTTSLRYEYPF